MSMQQLQELIEDYAHKMATMEAEFQARVTALAWSIAADALAKDVPAIIKKGPRPRPVLNVAATTKAAPGSKIERYGELLASKEGQWVSRGSDRIYTCLRQTADGESYELKSVKDDKTIEVKFTTLVSRWNHIA